VAVLVIGKQAAEQVKLKRGDRQCLASESEEVEVDGGTDGQFLFLFSSFSFFRVLSGV
jgi:hypothetical protein